MICLQSKVVGYNPVVSQAFIDIIVITLDLGLRPQSRVITMNQISNSCL